MGVHKEDDQEILTVPSSLLIGLATPARQSNDDRWLVSAAPGRPSLRCSRARRTIDATENHGAIIRYHVYKNKGRGLVSTRASN